MFLITYWFDHVNDILCVQGACRQMSQLIMFLSTETPGAK